MRPARTEMTNGASPQSSDSAQPKILHEVTFEALPYTDAAGSGVAAGGVAVAWAGAGGRSMPGSRIERMRTDV